MNGNWEGWVEFFLTAVKETSQKAAATASELIKLGQEDKNKIQNIGRSAGSVFRVHQALLQRPIISISKICEMTDLWATSATTAIGHLEKAGIVKEITGRKRNRLYKYVKYFDIIDEGIDIM